MRALLTSLSAIVFFLGAQPTQQPKLQQLIKMVIYSDGLGLRHTHTHHIIWPPDVYQPKVQLSIVVPKL